MKWTIELTDEEKELLKNTLEDLLSSIKGEVIINGPFRCSSWIESQGQREDWVDLIYRIEITSNLGSGTERFGLTTREGIRGDIKAHSLELARQFCIRVDPNLRSKLRDVLWKK